MTASEYEAELVRLLLDVLNLAAWLDFLCKEATR